MSNTNQSKLLQSNQTLYSFRHTGAIEIYKRTGSLTVLQQAMGLASLAVSLGYLRNLEVSMLRLEGIYAQLQHVFVLSLLKMTAPAIVREVAYPE